MLDNDKIKLTNYNHSSRDKKNNKFKWIIFVVLLVLATNALTAFLVTNALPKETADSKGSAYSGKHISIFNSYDEKDIEQFKKLFIVKDKLEKYYNGKIDENLLVEAAIKGMTNSLNDPYTVFMNKKEFEYLTTETEGSYVGLGIQVGVVDNQIVIIAPFEDSPAKKAGIQSGDVIKKVNGIEVTGKDLDKAVSMMKGKKGEKVNITIYRKDKGDMDLSIVRDEIKLNTVKAEMINDKIGYLQIFMFDENTGANVKKALDKLHSEGMKSLILDLRQNPGGLVSQCVDVASNFIPKGDIVVYTVDKYNHKKEYKSHGGKYTDLPIVILTDEGTASSSEILSGALRDYKRATLVGTKTFGKGVVQSVFYRRIDGFGDGTALKVTVSNYYTPSGDNLNKKGIKPDVEVKYPEELYNKDYNREIDPQFKKALEIANDKLNKK
ncbi:carboxy-terminal processing protease CtpA precursor [Clostridium tepidiprofundi DSM 19306]|uniref:Carboxy-terminal processing protease CtpA n=1 Tax=Clostridium tepidiprofundi DSM 19306 TaxID=1121338 RepID=A0A151B652_9CLOT|nr:S41 family peptidase [Clostridium tepidiprofundi]KYH35415.1 carboxy-terminal processing protease CtpA precursor [Clostridium tepidiprofundi DSM 19306]